MSEGKAPNPIVAGIVHLWWLWIIVAVFAVGVGGGLFLTTQVEPKQAAKLSQAWKSNLWPRPCPPFYFDCKMGDKSCAEAWSGGLYVSEVLGAKLLTRDKEKATATIVVEDAGNAAFCSGAEAAQTWRDDGFQRQVHTWTTKICLKEIQRAKLYAGWDPDIRSLGRFGVKYTFAHELLHPYMGRPKLHMSHPVWGVGLFAERPRYIEIGPVVKNTLIPHFEKCSPRKGK